MEPTDSLTAPSPPAPAASWPAKIGATLMALLLLVLSQGGVKLRLARFIFPSATLDKYIWIGYFEHHLLQLIIALIFIGIFSRGHFAEWGLNFRNAALSTRIFWKYCLVYTAIILATSVIPDLMHHDSDLGMFAPATAPNIAGWLAFEWIFVGISEEILFRGLLQTYLSKTWTGAWQIGVGRIRGFALPHSGLITTLIFCLAHVSPLPPHINWEQQLFAFGLGIYYSAVYYRTGSLLNPILAHNFGDGLVVTAAYLVYLHLH